MRLKAIHGFVLVAILAASIGAFPLASSVGAACTPLLAGTPGGALTPAGLVAGTLTWVGPSVTCTAGATDVLSAAAPCPTGFVGALPGVFCGPLIAPGGSGKCVWAPFVGGPSGIVAGYDLPTSPIGYDGNLGLLPGAGEATVYASTTPGVPTSFPNPSPTFVGKLMAFPYNGGLGPTPEDVTLVTCGT